MIGIADDICEYIQGRLGDLEHQYQEADGPKRERVMGRVQELRRIRKRFCGD